MVDYWIFFGLSVPFVAFILEVLKESLNPTNDSAETVLYGAHTKVNNFDFEF